MITLIWNLTVWVVLWPFFLLHLFFNLLDDYHCERSVFALKVWNIPIVPVVHAQQIHSESLMVWRICSLLADCIHFKFSKMFKRQTDWNKQFTTYICFVFQLQEPKSEKSPTTVWARTLTAKLRLADFGGSDNYALTEINVRGNGRRSQTGDGHICLSFVFEKKLLMSNRSLQCASGQVDW